MSGWVPLRTLRLARKARKLRERCDRLPSLEARVDEALRSGPFRPQQKRGELLALLRALEEIRPRRLLEIGAWRCGSLLLFSRVAAPEARIFSIDLRFPPERRAAARALVGPAQEAVALERDSHAPGTVDEVRRLLGGELLDFLFIDGDHSLAGVAADYKLWSPLVRPGGLIAFHDIVPARAKVAAPGAPDPGGVPEFWASLRSGDPGARELVEDPGQEGYGIGVLLRGISSPAPPS